MSTAAGRHRPPPPGRRRPGLADLPALMLPALLLAGVTIYTAWASWSPWF